MSAENQIKKLGDFILENYPEYIIDGGAGDVAIEIIKDLQSRLDRANDMDLYEQLVSE